MFYTFIETSDFKTVPLVDIYQIWTSAENLVAVIFIQQETKKNIKTPPIRFKIKTKVVKTRELGVTAKLAS